MSKLVKREKKKRDFKEKVRRIYVWLTTPLVKWLRARGEKKYLKRVAYAENLEDEELISEFVEVIIKDLVKRPLYHSGKVEFNVYNKPLNHIQLETLRSDTILGSFSSESYFRFTRLIKDWMLYNPNNKYLYYKQVKEAVEDAVTYEHKLHGLLVNELDKNKIDYYYKDVREELKSGDRDTYRGHSIDYYLRILDMSGYEKTLVIEV